MFRVSGFGFRVRCSSYRMYVSISFKKSPPPQNRQLHSSISDDKPYSHAHRSVPKGQVSEARCCCQALALPHTHLLSLSLALSHTLIHTHTRSCSLSLTLSLSHTHTNTPVGAEGAVVGGALLLPGLGRSLALARSLSVSISFSLSLSLSLARSLSLSLSLALSLSLSLSLTPTLFGRRCRRCRTTTPNGWA